MIVLLLKSQLALFDKIVPVAGSVSKDGTVTAPHYAHRKVRAPAPKVEHAAKVAHTGELFGDAPAAPAPKKAAKPKQSETLDLFADQPAAVTSASYATKDDLRAAAAAPEVAPDPEPDVAGPAGMVGVDDGSFDASKVPSFGVEAGTSKEKRREINSTAASLVMLPPSARSESDTELLRQYSGNGGCGDSLNEFYTDPKVAAAMWHAVRALGLPDGGTVLEPSAATGVFLETAPASIRVTGVELDPISARIGAALHPRHEMENASLERFATQDARQFDAVIGNVPFGVRGSLIKDDKSDLKTAEAYFLDTALDKTRSGGVVALIVPTGVMDSKRDRKVRERLLRKGEFLGALRMPNTAFEHSHTGVTSDVVFFRKRPEDVAGALSAVDQATLRGLGVWDDEYLAGSYFTERGAGNVLGTMTDGWRAQAGMGNDITVEGSMVGVPEAIAAFKAEDSTTSGLTVEAILAAVKDEPTRERVRAGAVKRPYDTAKRGDVKTVDGVGYILEGQPLRWHRVDEFMASQAVVDAVELSAEIGQAIAGVDVPGLADRVRAYVDEHGVPSKNPDLMLAASQDKALYRLIGAVKPDGMLSDVVTGRKAMQVASTFDSAAQSLALENGWFKPEQVAARWHGGDTETALDHLYAAPDYALDPVSGLWTSNDQYLSGEMWPKLDEAIAALAGEDVKPEDRAKFERQAKALEEAIDPKSLEDVDVALNSAFLPLDVVAAFFNERKREAGGWAATQPDLVITFDAGVYALKGGGYDTGLLGKYLNRTGVKKDDEMPTIDGWNAEFKVWLCSSSYRDQVEDLYNRSFRGFRQREYSNAAFEIPGLNAEGLKDYQYGGIRWALEAGKGIVAADVGLGKTARGLILTRMAKVTGKAKKPLIIVPKSVLANWLSEAERWFPGCSVLTIGETYTRDKDGKLKGRQDSAAERNRKFHDLTQNDYDFVLITQPAWNDLDLDPITKGEYIESDFWVQRGDALGNAGDKRTNKIRESYKQAVAQREFKSRSDAIYFNDLGVDMIIGDEMHAYKNLYAAKNRFGQAPKFLGGSGLSNRALDMALKTRWLREQNGGMNVYGLTATPTKNSPLEIYSMLTHIAPEAFEKIGVRNSEEFLDRFCEFRTENILTTGGNIEEALVTVGFKNMDELREIMRRYIDRKTADDVGLLLPKRDDRQHLVEMSAEQKAVYADLREAASKAKGKDATGDAHIFSIMAKMGKAAMDLELYDPDAYAGAVSPKYDEAATHIAAGAADGGQVVFADNIAVHDKMVATLVAKGVAREHIGVINAQVAASSAARQNIADAFNSGRLKVVIGNTATMGEGINLQKGTTDIHHMDLPWEPASMQQRNGRGLRQGNLSEAVRIHSYIAKGSFDGYRYQTIAAKKDWQDLLWNGGDRVENLAREGALSRDDLMVMLAADPEKAREDLAKNKEAAKERFAALKNSEAAANFSRFQDMRRSLSAMKGKDRERPAAQRLQVKVDRLKATLEADAHFKAKAALDVDSPVLIQPTTGEPFHAGVAFEMPKDAGALHGGGKFVVTGIAVDPTHGPEVQIRRYGEATTQSMAFKLPDLAHGVTTFAYDAASEQADIGRHLEASAKEKMSTLTNFSDVRSLPPAAVEANYALIQRAVKEGAKAYKFQTGYGAVGLVGPDGRAAAEESYSANARLDTHDLMLPTAAHRAKAIEAYVADEKAKRFDTEYRQARRGSDSKPHTVVRYPGSYSQATNRWLSIGTNVFGEDFGKDAKAAYESGAYAAARKAPTLPEAIRVLAPMASNGYQHSQWPRRALAVLWAHAKRDGKLGEPLVGLLPTVEKYGHQVASVPSELFNSANPAIPGATTQVLGKPVGEALAKIARDRGYRDMADAMEGILKGDDRRAA